MIKLYTGFWLWLVRQKESFSSKGFSVHFLKRHLLMNKSKTSTLFKIYWTNSFWFNLIKSDKNNNIPSLKFSLFFIEILASFSSNSSSIISLFSHSFWIYTKIISIIFFDCI